MKKNVKFLIVPVILAFALFSCNKQGTVDQDAMLKARPNPAVNLNCYSGPVDLISGQTLIVGTVEVMPCDGGIKVKYDVADGYMLSAVHVEVVSSETGFTLNSAGNPQIGNFPVNVSFMASEEKTEYITDCIAIPAATINEDNVFIAAHAEVCEIVGYSDPIMGTACVDIPETAVMKNLGRNGQISYNKLAISESGDPEFDGIYNGWCIEPMVFLYTNETYKVDLLCSLGDLSSLAGRIVTGNIDLVNFILNQDYIGYVPEGLGAITVEDVQMALWKLVKEEGWVYNGSLTFNLARVNWIIAQTAGQDGYLPGCGDEMAVILVPTEPVAPTTREIPAQLTIITVPVPCVPVYNCETAWARGKSFPGNSWAMYFKYCY